MIRQFRTGITGFDQLTNGGLPVGRTTLVTGDPGSGKTNFLLSILAVGVIPQGEPAVFLSFEERPDDIILNARSIGVDLAQLIEAGALRIDHIAARREGMTEVGAYTLDGLRMRIRAVLNSVGARYLALDTAEALFTIFDSARAVRAELVRMLNDLADEGITTIMSAERGDGRLTRHGFEEYVADCVILLENDTQGDVATRRLRVVKYRGGHHGPNKYPFLIDERGVSVMPITSALLDHQVSRERIATGIGELDDALGGGVRKGSTVLFIGGTGAGKTILASRVALAACKRGERTIFQSFEEAPEELLENVSGAGVDLRLHVETGALHVVSARPTLMGLERHLVELYRLVEDVSPSVVVIDPVSSLATAGDRDAVYRTVVRIIDVLKRRGTTALITMEPSEIGDRDRSIEFTSILDTLIELTATIGEDSVRRELRVIKARGIDHDHRRIAFTLSGRPPDAGGDDVG